jgi:repressor LexA
MTPRWEMVLRFLKAYIQIHGCSPTYEVLAKGMGLKSRANAHRIVKRLEAEGLLDRKPRKFYGVKIRDKSVDEVLSL